MADPRLKDQKFLDWAIEIKKIFDFTCQICYVRGGKLVAHHLQGWDSFISERYELNNGVCLCEKDHENFHNIYGFGGNTKIQFEEYKDMLKLIQKVVKNNVK